MNLFPSRPGQLKFTGIFILIFFCGLNGRALSDQASSAGEEKKITVIVENLRNKKGRLQIALFNQVHPGFPDKRFRLIGSIVRVTGSTIRVTLRTRASGPFTLALFHDENGNGLLDRNVIGIPIEGYGFSNNPDSRFGPPEYGEAIFKMEGNRIRIKIRMIYIL